MEYTDNPRKILGRVDVIYSDTEISKDIQTTESGNSAISHPNEVFVHTLCRQSKAVRWTAMRQWTAPFR